jgi:hypothetical protein
VLCLCCINISDVLHYNDQFSHGIKCNTLGVTVAAIIHLQFLYISCYSVNLIQWRCCFLLLKLDQLKSIGKFKFSNSCALWIIKLNRKFFRIYWNQIRPHFQKIKCSSQLVIQVSKFEKKILSSENIYFKCPNRAK